MTHVVILPRLEARTFAAIKAAPRQSVRSFNSNTAGRFAFHHTWINEGDSLISFINASGETALVSQPLTPSDLSVNATGGRCGC